MSRLRQENHDAEGGHADERWLITYADVLTLMFVLFMVLFSISVVNTSRFELLKESLEVAFSGGIAPGGSGIFDDASQSPVSQALVDFPSGSTESGSVFDSSPTLLTATPAQALESAQLEDLEERVDADIARSNLAGKVETSVDERGLEIRVLTDDLLFATASAQLAPGADRVLDPIATKIKSLPNAVRIEGHTDPRPITTARFPSNWELSTGRSGAVLRYLVGAGVDQTRLQSTGFAATRPIASNATAEGQSQNRRVEILVLRREGAPADTPESRLGG